MEFEKLGSFYLGKELDPTSGQLLNRLVMYDARNLSTHAVCLGMTGSGKTGLCVDLLEEAAIDRIPALIIDPKGDITNLLLQFPDLDPADFRPWVSPEDARRKGFSIDEFAEQQANLWRQGLAEWGQDGSRIARLKESAEYRIYTPGSQAGRSVSILSSLNAPRLDWNTQSEVLRERISGIVSALLSLVGIEADPVRSREHILLANLVEHFWREGSGLDFQKLILAIQTPPLERLGVFDVDTFFPANDRFELAMGLNSLLASPSFGQWLSGEPLDIEKLLVSAEGKPCHSIFYIAHLSESERLFFVALLLNQLIGWMRMQPGTTSLRALLYMDELFGFLPPVAEPPSKRPLLTLLKQARAYGIGLVLATQNPVDLDYKGLTNAGTWFIGRLQAERDKQRVLDGLIGAAGEAGGSLDKAALDSLISGLGKRVFLLHNVHAESPVVFQTRWAMSYLRGPLTRDQIGQLERGASGPAEGAVSPALSTSAAAAAPPFPSSSLNEYLETPPALGPKVVQEFLSREQSRSTSGRLEMGPMAGGLSNTLLYHPKLLASGSVHFFDKTRAVDEREDFHLLIPVSEAGVDWERCSELTPPLLTLPGPEPSARFSPLPAMMNEEKEISRLAGDVADHLYRTRRLVLFHNRALRLYSRPGESSREFSLRVTQTAREARDQEVDELNRRYEKRLETLQDRLDRAEMALARKEAEAESRSRELLVSVGESVLGMFLGRKSLRSASSSLGKYRMKTSASLAREEAEEKVEDLQEEVERLKAELREETVKILEEWEKTASEIEEVPVSPRRSDVRVERVSIAWEPSWLP